MGGLRIRLGAQAPIPISLAVARAALALSGRSVGLALSSDFSTSFPTIENPLSQGGIWNTGLGVGLDWTNPKVTADGCVASVVPTPNRYSDDIATLKTSFRTFTANQFAQAVAWKLGGYSGGGGSHELELFLRGGISAHSAVGYEVSIGISPSPAVYAFVVRWNGVAGNFTALIDPGHGIGSYTNTPSVPVTGDVWRGEISGTTIKAFQNGVQILQITDSTFSSGQPGLGFWPVDGATPANFGWRSFLAGDL